MHPKRIILIRHGQSEGNSEPGIYKNKPDYALELTQNGIEQAIAAGKQLKTIVNDESMFFYVSPFFRTRSTFENIVKNFPREQFSFIEEPRLREQERGHLRTKEENKEIEEERDSYGTFYFRFPDGESCADVFDRVSDFLGTLLRDFTKSSFAENAIIITHGMSIRLFLMRWLHWTVEEFELLANPRNCQMVVLELDQNGKYHLKSELLRRPAKHQYQRPITLQNK